MRILLALCFVALAAVACGSDDDTPIYASEATDKWMRCVSPA
jgi:hypothetical protein